MKIEDYNKYYIQGSDHYLIPKDVFIELFNEMSNWREESKELNQKYLNAVADYETTMAEKNELKKQLKEYKRLGFKHLNDKCNKLENQQKEFIDYLESEINKIKEQIKNYDIWHEVGTDINFLILKKQFNIEILSKYKEIIGGKDE